MPNKYIKMGGKVVEPGESEHPVFATASSEEQRAIFSTCLGTERSKLISSNVSVNFVVDDCKSCLQMDKVVQLRTTIWRNVSQPPLAHTVNVSLQC